MMWKAIGQKAIGTSHLKVGKGCEDAIEYSIIKISSQEEVLICCISDGAGSAKYAAEAARHVTKEGLQILSAWVNANVDLTESKLYDVAERLYDYFEKQAHDRQVPINEFSCTFLGCIIYNTKAVFFQIGDGVIVRHDGTTNYVAVWPPDNGEYQNTTTFLIDDPNFRKYKAIILNEVVTEVALLTDGLQLLALNIEFATVHQPFFSDMFKWLRMANDQEKQNILNNKLAEYLNSNLINDRTDDDKTLFLATRLNHDGANS